MEIKTNFLYPDIVESDRIFGASISGDILRPDGNWLDYLPLDEDQNIRGIESSACYVEAQQASIATLQEEVFNIKDSNYSARFNALLSGGTEQGGDPLKGAYSIKKDGLIPQSMMDFGNDIQSWNDFHSWKGVKGQKCLLEGRNQTNLWDMSYKIVFERGDSLESKYANLREALKRSPVPISVSAWFMRNGQYYKPKGMSDNHFVEAVFVDDQNRIHIRDTYSPYLKVLEPNYDCEFALYWVIKKKVTQEQYNGFLSKLIDILKLYVQLLSTTAKSVGSIIKQIYTPKQGD